VVPAGSGDEGRQILEQDQAFDLVLCDVMMPAMSGMTLHTWLAGTHPGLAERVVFITGGAFTPTAREYLAKVGNLQVEKPFDKVNFRTMIAELIVAFRARS
jgi:CheY-like chemotaxis protein